MFLPAFSGRFASWMAAQTAAPEEIRVGDVLRLTEGDLAPVSCLSCGAVPCPRAASCRTLPMWAEYARRTNEFFDGITLADLMAGPSAPEYVI